MAETQLGFPHEAAEAAYRTAVGAQNHAEESMQSLGRWPCVRPSPTANPLSFSWAAAITLSPPKPPSRSAASSPAWASGSFPAIVSPRKRIGPTAWHYPNLIMNAVALAKRHPNLFLLYVSNFSCTIDAFTHSFFAAELGAKPYLMLEIDAHTADAGIQTRLEAFWDIIRNYHAPAAAPLGFQPAAVDGDGTVVTSAGPANLFSRSA